jgi:excisionase family DNA binding protein
MEMPRETASRKPEVLSLEELADYLRIPKDVVEREASRGHIPGRRMEDTWRFLRSAVDDWLRAHDARALLLEQAGVFAADRTLPSLLAAIYAERGRPESNANA